MIRYEKFFNEAGFPLKCPREMRDVMQIKIIINLNCQRFEKHQRMYCVAVQMYYFFLFLCHGFIYQPH